MSEQGIERIKQQLQHSMSLLESQTNKIKEVLLREATERARADKAEAACAAHESVGREIMAERDQARAACAEMRAELEKLQMGAAAMRSVLEWWQPRTEAADGRRRRALAASDAGKGFLPPEKARELEAELKAIADALLATDYQVNGQTFPPNLVARAGLLIAERARLRAALARRERTVAFAESKACGVWLWQGDGEDHPESLSCPVLMSADQVRELEARNKRLATAILVFAHEMDKVMTGPSTYQRGQTIARLVNELQALAENNETPTSEPKA